MRLFIIICLSLMSVRAGCQDLPVEKMHMRTFKGDTPQSAERKGIPKHEVERLVITSFSDSVFPGPEILSYPNLTSLWIMGVPLSVSPREHIPRSMPLVVDTGALRRLVHLRHLAIWHFDLRYLPTQLFHLERLQGLTVNYCNLDSLSSQISRLAELELLDLSFNHLKELPASLAELDSLKVLALNSNHLQSLPKVVLDVPGLRKLDLGNYYGEEWNISSRTWPYPICNNHIDWESDTTLIAALLRHPTLERITFPRDECGDPLYFNRSFPSRPAKLKVKWEAKPVPCPDPWPERAFVRFPIPFKEQFDRGKCLCGLKGL